MDEKDRLRVLFRRAHESELHEIHRRRTFRNRQKGRNARNTRPGWKRSCEQTVKGHIFRVDRAIEAREMAAEIGSILMMRTGGPGRFTATLFCRDSATTDFSEEDFYFATHPEEDAVEAQDDLQPGELVLDLRELRSFGFHIAPLLRV